MISGHALAEHEPQLQAAYDALAGVGRQTAAPDGEWDELVDRAHQALGVMLALILAARVRDAQGEGGIA